MRHFLLLAITMLLIITGGCATKTIYQVDGMPISNNIVKAKTFNLGLTIKYSLTNYFEVKEGDETYETYELLSLTTTEIHKIKDPSRICMNISIFNPKKENYKITKYITIEGGEEKKEVVYDGKLSRNSFVIELPLVQNKLVSFYYDACDKSDSLVFKSFRAQYIIERTNEFNSDSSNH